MSGKEWLRQYLISKTDECCELEQKACNLGNHKTADKYTVAYFKLINQLLVLGVYYNQETRRE